MGVKVICFQGFRCDKQASKISNKTWENCMERKGKEMGGRWRYASSGLWA